jgi:D-serine deaminase-like pyridoxal phosphate-dependent protein
VTDQPTPTVNVDLDRVHANIGRWHGTADAAGVTLRPHVKGHRSVEIARMQVTAGAPGLALYSAQEAEHYLDAGITDLVIVHPWRDPWRWPRIAALALRGSVAVHVDHADAVAGLGEAAVSAGVTLGVRVVLDNGMGVAGAAPDDVVTLARSAAATPGLRLDGVTGYVALNTTQDTADRIGAGRRMAESLLRLAARLRADGIPCPVVAVGGTPTAAGALPVDGVTEVCAGAYALFDGGMAELGVCADDEVALTVSARATPDGTDAGPLLTGSAYPWTHPEHVATVLRRDDRSVTLRPAHVCPVVRQAQTLRVHTGGVEVAQWPVVYARDREP